jgi:hypothetical protein
MRRATRYLLGAYLRTGEADPDSPWIDTIRRLGADWARSTDARADSVSADTIFADKIRIKAMKEFLLIAGAGDSHLQIFIVAQGSAAPREIVSIDLGEAIDDLEFAGPDRIVLLNHGGSTIIDFTL